jgi:rhodanese-related sulfurtransferase
MFHVSALQFTKGVMAMRNSRFVFHVVIMLTALLCATSFVASAAAVPRISIDELNMRLGESDLVILDVRSGQDWSQSDKQIVGSVRVNPGAVNQWAGNYPKDKVIVLYCT